MVEQEGAGFSAFSVAGDLPIMPRHRQGGNAIMDKRIAVIGAGAIGGYTGGHLAHNGFDVTLIDPWPEHIEAIRKDGLAIEGVTQEEFVCAQPKTMHLTEVQDLAKQKPIDIAMVSVKSYDTEWATMLIGQYLAPDGYVVSLQNCMNEERIAGVVGADKTVGVIPALLGAELYAPGRVRRTAAKGASPYEVYRAGELHGRITKRIEELAEMIRTIDSVRATTNLWGERWSKLCVNGMANGVAAATGLSGNDMNRDDKIRRLSIRLAGEGVRVGQALGYQLEHIRMHEPETIARAAEGDPAALDEVESAILAALQSNTRSELARPSMGQDMFKGRRTEIDFINGVIAAKGVEVGVPTPTHVKLIQAVKQVEHGKIPARAENLYGI
jgi:2-dehydropantoate 2-reductase